MKTALLINWDNYPNVTSGGIYTWEKSLIDSMPDWKFVVFNQLSNSGANADVKIPSRVKVIEFPIFGTNRYQEFYRESAPLLPKIFRTGDATVRNEFVPLFGDFLGRAFADDCDLQGLANSVLDLHNFLAAHDAKKCFEHYRTWEVFLDKLCSDSIYRRMALNGALSIFQLLQRGLQVLSVRVPRVDVVHCSLAWLPSLVAVGAKAESKCPVIVTEHGVAFRELFLSVNATVQDEPTKQLWKRFATNIVRLVYFVSDVIAPVCSTNEAWERSLGVPRSKIRVIYNGIDINRFRPMEVDRKDLRPTVVSVGRINIFKDIIGLMQAISYSTASIPDIQCLLYGEAFDLEYSVRCVRLVKDLKLENNFRFMGRTDSPQVAYNSGDIVAFTSVSEGFPFAVIEPMACGKAVVAVDVGGVREALEGCGILVRPRRPHDLANGVVTLLRNASLRNELAARALSRAREKFSLERAAAEYKDLYSSITTEHPTERGEALTWEMVVGR